LLGVDIESVSNISGLYIASIFGNKVSKVLVFMHV
jgi:hypothetical protein